MCVMSQVTHKNRYEVWLSLLKKCVATYEQVCIGAHRVSVYEYTRIAMKCVSLLKKCVATYSMYVMGHVTHTILCVSWVM